VTWPPLGVDERAAERYLSGLRDRLHFLVLEVRQQLEATQVAMAGSAAVEEQILAREDYIDNLKSTLENSVYAILGEITDEHDEESMISLVRAVNVIATNLERIADFCVNIVGQLRYIEHRSLLREIGCDVYFDDMIAEFSAIEEGLWQRDM